MQMRELVSVKSVFLTIIGGIGGWIAQLFGGWGEDMTTLLLFMGVDFVTGLLIAAVWKKSVKSGTGALNSWSAWKGLARKGVTLLIVLVAHRLDLLIGVGYIRTAVIIAFCANELISIVENLGIMGVPFPAMIVKAVDLLKEKSEQEGMI